MIRRQDLIARFEPQRSGDEIYSVCRIRDINKVIRRRVEVLSQRLARLFQEPVQLAAEKKNGLALQTQLPALIHFEDRSGCCSEGTMIEKNNIRV